MELTRRSMCAALALAPATLAGLRLPDAPLPDPEPEPQPASTARDGVVCGAAYWVVDGAIVHKEYVYTDRTSHEMTVTVIDDGDWHQFAITYTVSDERCG